MGKKVSRARYWRFFLKKSKREATVITQEVKEKVSELSLKGYDLNEISIDCGVKVDTLKKAISSGRVQLLKPALNIQNYISKSDRSIEDSLSGMGEHVPILLSA